jgi:type II secretory pathway component PulF
MPLDAASEAAASEAGAAPPPSAVTSVLIALSVVFAALDFAAIGGWLLLGWQVTPSFRGMFADFGAALPTATRLVIDPAYGLGMAVAMALALGGMVLAAVLVSLRPAGWASLLGALLVANLAALGVTVWALYLPIFAMAGSIQ